jgi:hypothetical protein
MADITLNDYNDFNNLTPFEKFHFLKSRAQKIKNIFNDDDVEHDFFHHYTEEGKKEELEGILDFISAFRLSEANRLTPEELNDRFSLSEFSETFELLNNAHGGYYSEQLNEVLRSIPDNDYVEEKNRSSPRLTGQQPLSGLNDLPKMHTLRFSAIHRFANHSV